MTTPVSLAEATNLIVEQAKQSVKQLIEVRGNDKPPFLPQAYAPLLGVKRTIEADLGDLGAVLLRFSDGYEIKINRNHLESRRNFSCAHELGHVLVDELHLGSRLEDIEYRSFNPQAQSRARARAKERLCDIAATELLMPESVFQQYLAEFGGSASCLERLAKVFRVSIQTTAIRMAEVSPKPCVALLWQHQATRRSKGLHLAWCVGPGRNPLRKSHCTPVPDAAPSTLYRAYEANDLVRCRKSFRIGATTRRLLMESKGFGFGERRYVVSLAFLNS